VIVSVAALLNVSPLAPTTVTVYVYSPGASVQNDHIGADAVGQMGVEPDGSVVENPGPLTVVEPLAVSHDNTGADGLR
jgi:hypothetical protein